MIFLFAIDCSACACRAPFITFNEDVAVCVVWTFWEASCALACLAHHFPRYLVHDIACFLVRWNSFGHFSGPITRFALDSLHGYFSQIPCDIPRAAVMMRSPMWSRSSWVRFVSIGTTFPVRSLIDWRRFRFGLDPSASFSPRL